MLDAREFSSYPITRFTRVEAGDVDSENYFATSVGEMKIIETRGVNGKFIRKEVFVYDTTGTSHILSSTDFLFMGSLGGTTVPSFIENGAWYYILTAKTIGGVDYAPYEIIGCVDNKWVKCVPTATGIRKEV